WRRKRRRRSLPRPTHQLKTWISKTLTPLPKTLMLSPMMTPNRSVGERKTTKKPNTFPKSRNWRSP
ncbi:hypothetical protein Gogos_018088, partial [Gossypium gossypioides]|nr:hypothetical protein [Gossypium gossypioides]